MFAWDPANRKLQCPNCKHAYCVVCKARSGSGELVACLALTLASRADGLAPRRALRGARRARRAGRVCGRAQEVPKVCCVGRKSGGLRLHALPLRRQLLLQLRHAAGPTAWCVIRLSSTS